MTKDRVKQLKLIDGVFTPTEAHSVLNALIDNKISYHKIDDFSHHIRDDRHPHHSKERILELQEAKDSLRKWLGSLGEKPSKLTIKGVISIEVDDDFQQP